jgi:hypothetical protein
MLYPIIGLALPQIQCGAKRERLCRLYWGAVRAVRRLGAATVGEVRAGVRGECAESARRVRGECVCVALTAIGRGLAQSPPGPV